MWIAFSAPKFGLNRRVTGRVSFQQELNIVNIIGKGLPGAFNIWSNFTNIPFECLVILSENRHALLYFFLYDFNWMYWN